MVKKWGRKLLSLFLALVLALAMSVTAFAFSDTRGHWAEETIQAMTEKGYLSGYPDGTFGPNNTIRRAEFMRILTSMYGLTERSDAYILWTDVRSDAWYAPCMGAGLLLPLYPGHYIYPEEPLTRLDAAYAILMTHDIEFDYESTSAQSMGDYAGYAGDADVCAVISTALDRGIMKGTGSGFAPYEYMTRAELCTLLSRLNPEEADVEKLNGIIDSLIDDVAASAPAQVAPGTVEGYSEEYEQALFEMVNTARTENGLPALSWSNALAGIARNHGADMIQRGYYDHVDPEGRGPDYRADAAGISYYLISENIAAGNVSPEVIFDGWMASPDHRYNILDPEVDQVGIGVVLGGEMGIYWVQCFIG